jgi:hypothetical protein
MPVNLQDGLELMRKTSDVAGSKVTSTDNPTAGRHPAETKLGGHDAMKYFPRLGC